MTWRSVALRSVRGAVGWSLLRRSETMALREIRRILDVASGVTAFASLTTRLENDTAACCAGKAISIRERRSRVRALVTRSSPRGEGEFEPSPSEVRLKAIKLEQVPTTPSPSALLRGTESDEQLLAAFQRGNREAFIALYRRHRHKVRTLALSLTRDENDAREVEQEAFIRVLRHWSRFEGQSAFYTWLYRIVYNLAMDRLRRPHQRHLPIEQVDQLIPERLTSFATPPITPNPFDACSAMEVWRQILEAIQMLPSHHREIVVMREVQGMSYTEMADSLGCSKGTVMSRLFHARQRLQRQLQQLHSECIG